eukprot:765230-Hanusia_phi.AAC.6
MRTRSGSVKSAIAVPSARNSGTQVIASAVLTGTCRTSIKTAATARTPPPHRALLHYDLEPVEQG